MYLQARSVGKRVGQIAGKRVGKAAAYAAVLLLVGCAGQPSPSSSAGESPSAVEPAVSPVTPSATRASASPVTDWVPPLLASPEEEAAYYVSRLADRSFVSQYGGPDNPRPWYIAAERLGEIGAPAVPLLLARLNTQDAYELMLVLYALHLATQDPLITFQTRGESVQLPGVLDERMNADNRRLVEEWQQRHAAALDLG